MPADLLAAITAFDRDLAVAANGLLRHWPAFDLFAAWLVKSHLTRFVPFVVVGCWLWFAARADADARRVKLAEGLLTGLAALFIARVLALTLPFRLRPVEALQLEIPMDTGLRSWSSFPSDHAVLAFVLAATLWRVSRAVGAWALLHAAVIVCLPRLLFGFHYATDLVAGALLGLAMVAIVARIDLRGAFSRPLLGFERHQPAAFYSVTFFLLFEISEMFDSVRAVAVNVFRLLRPTIG